MKLREHIGKISELKVYHPEYKQVVKLVSAYRVEENGIGLWFEVPGKNQEIKPWIFENMEEALDMEIIKED